MDGGVEWWMVEQKGGWWSRMVDGGAEGWMVEQNGGWWSRRVDGGVEWWMVEQNGGRWSRMVDGGIGPLPSPPKNTHSSNHPSPPPPSGSRTRRSCQPASSMTPFSGTTRPPWSSGTPTLTTGAGTVARSKTPWVLLTPLPTSPCIVSGVGHRKWELCIVSGVVHRKWGCAS